MKKQLSFLACFHPQPRLSFLTAARRPVGIFILVLSWAHPEPVQIGSQPGRQTPSKNDGRHGWDKARPLKIHSKHTSRRRICVVWRMHSVRAFLLYGVCGMRKNMFQIQQLYLWQECRPLTYDNFRHFWVVLCLFITSENICGGQHRVETPTPEKHSQPYSPPLSMGLSVRSILCFFNLLFFFGCMANNY